jgi:hypothetical protein
VTPLATGRVVAATSAALAPLIVAAAVAAGPPSRQAAPASPPARAGTGYEAGIAAWRAAHEEDLEREDGYLAVAGLFFLEPGPNDFGAAASNRIVLPEGTAPARAGTMTLRDGRVFFEIADHVDARIGGQAVTRGELRPALSEPRRPADLLRIGRVTLLVHASGSRLAIRLRDPEGPARRNFAGMRWFPVDRRWRVSGRFEAFDKPRSVRIVNILGDEVEYASPGIVRFDHRGHALSLTPVVSGEGLWFIFTDQTAGRSTYKASRFLYTPLPKDGNVELDFNKAENPPCAYNAFTTCPLPPKENRLPVAVEAGERAYAGTVPLR